MSNLLKPDLNKDYNQIKYGKGVYLYSIDGKEFLDGCSGAIVANIGHGVEEIAKAAFEQTKKVSFIYRTQFTSESAEELAKRLVNKAPGMDFAFFVNSGSEATELACRLAIQYWQEKNKPFKQKILSRKISYHGTTLGALSISGNFSRRTRYNFLLKEFPTVPAPYCYNCPLGLKRDNCALKCADELEQSIKEFGSDSIAAFIAEPIIGASGAIITPPEGYYQKIREICNKYDILFITDEVMTGLGRTGKWFAIEHWGIEPDIVALGKGLSAGYSPIAAILASKKVIEPIINGSGMNVFGHTYSGNPLSTKVSLAVLDYLEDNSLLDNVNSLEPLLDQYLSKLQKKYPIIADIRGKGLLKGVEFCKELSQDNNIVKDVAAAAYQEGLLIYPSIGISNITDGQGIIIAPPFVITEIQLNDLFNRMDRALERLMIKYKEESIYES